MTCVVLLPNSFKTCSVETELRTFDIIKSHIHVTHIQVTYDNISNKLERDSKLVSTI